MKTKKYWILVVVSFCILIVLWPGRRITGETGLYAKEKKNDSNLTAREKSASSSKILAFGEKDILQGLEGVRILVSYTDEPELRKHGLTKKALQTDTELQFRQYGIKVLTDEESTPTSEITFFNVLVDIVRMEESTIVAAEIRVQFNESVLLLRKPNRICMFACTWERGELVLGDLREIEDIRGVVKDLVNEFINDYLAANPEHKPTIKKSNESSEKKLTTGSTHGVVTTLSYDAKNPFVQIDDQIKLFREGDTIYGVKIVKIHKDRVVFEKEGTEETIRWTQKIGEAPKEHWE